MKITIVQGAFYPVPPLRGGAIERFWYDMGKVFARHGHEVLHISRQCDDLPPREIIEGVRHQRLPGFDFVQNPWQMKMRDLIYTRRVLGQLARADILVTNTFWFPLLLRNSSRGKVVVHVARYPKIQHRWYAASRFQVVSQAVAKALDPLLSPENKRRVRVIPYAVREGNPELKLTQPLQLLYVGRVHPEKGLHVLVEAFVRLSRESPDLRLRVVGPTSESEGGGGEAYWGVLKELGKAAGDKIEWLGPIFEYEKLQEEYRRAALMIYPSLAEKGESFGLAPLEAMSCGCPAVVSTLECFQDYLEPGENGWSFDHRTQDPSDALVRVLQSALGNVEQLQVMRTAAWKTAQRYTLERVAEAFLEDFAELLTES